MSNRMYFHLKLSFHTNISYYRNVVPQFTGELSLGPFTHPIHTHDDTRCTSYVGQQFITLLPSILVIVNLPSAEHNAQ